MPITKKGEKALAQLKKEYGPEQGKNVFYGLINNGKGKGWKKQR